MQTGDANMSLLDQILYADIFDFSTEVDVDNMSARNLAILVSRGRSQLEFGYADNFDYLDALDWARVMVEEPTGKQTAASLVKQYLLDCFDPEDMPDWAKELTLS
jgi:hypothetical protein